MSVRRDPGDSEVSALEAYVGDFSDKRVLEIGCGNGRLTARYARKAGQVVAIDPNPEKIEDAIRTWSIKLKNVEFRPCELEEFDSDESFDLAILSWSL